MSAVFLLDTVELLAALAGLTFLIIGWRKALPHEVKLFIAAILLFKVYHGFSNVMQWGGVTLVFDRWEDYLEILIPGFYAVLVILYGKSLSEREAREREERLRIVYDSIRDMIFAFEYSHERGPGRIVDANKAFLNKLGYTRDELLLLDEKVLEDVTKSTASIDERVRALKEEGQITFETVIVGKREGRRIEAEVISHLVEIEGRLINLSAIRDITERKRTEQILLQAKEDLERQNEELLKLDRMKDALISDISHELKTPVAKHVMQMEILRNVLGRHNVVAKVEDVLGVMEEGIRRQQSVIRNILMMSRLEAGGREYCSAEIHLDRVLRQITDDWMHAIAAFGIELETDLRTAVVLGDEEMLWHVFSNVIGNAIKYRADAVPKMSVLVEAREGRARVTVRDNGVGLTAEEREKAFDRFYQASPSTEGIGLGLNISQMILERFGGDIDLQSGGKGKGTTVSLSFPLAE